jgi:hypothetical protein
VLAHALETGQLEWLAKKVVKPEADRREFGRRY